jgi:hypothetical protein
MTRWEQEPTHPPSELGDLALPENASAKYVTEGLNARPSFARLQLEGEIFLLTFPFIEPNVQSSAKTLRVSP